MRVAEFRNKGDNELLQTADHCFAQMEQSGAPEHPALLLKAQLYMNEVDRRHDAQIARRDFRMELVVIFLILLEVIIGVGGFVYGVVEANKQAMILGQMNSNTAATAALMQDTKALSVDQATKLKMLAEEETKSLDSLHEMNRQMRASLGQIDKMTSAMKEQLAILREDQSNRRAQLSKKPKLELDIGGVPLNTFFKVPIKAREFTDTKAVYDVFLKNLGDATATKGLLRIVVYAKDVGVQSNAPIQRPYEEANSVSHTFLSPFDYLRPSITLPMSLTISYPKGQQPFVVEFNVDVDELPPATPLGAMTVTPKGW